ncbi:MAG TPA: MotA/TolQ/ExbB proton channel family protein [Armatimonadota bacterium]|nr:MotA/TolQ/ExbB proton channel family protein [Armatimonadota bacterium]
MTDTSYPLFQYFKDGGPLMWPLLLCSVAGLTVILYKAYQFLAIKGSADPLITEVEKCVRSGEHDEAHAACKSFRGPVGEIIRAGLNRAGQGKEVIREAVQDVGMHELATLESFLPTLQTIGNIAPLLGFLGTVLGMIQAFSNMSRMGLGPEAVTGGIAQALITTATGLMVAVPALVFYNYFASRVNGFSLQMERAASHAVSLLADGEGAAE